MEDKASLRAALAQRRAEAAAAQPDAGAQLSAHWRWGPPGGIIVAGYVRFRTEIDPAPLMAFLAGQGARLCLPVTPTAPNAPLRFRAHAPGDALAKGRFGVAEPLDTAPDVRPSLLLTPLLGFDRAGGRLGYGQGHYDRTLAQLRAAGPVLAIGLAYDAQEAPAMPAEAHDQRLDGVLTPTQAIVTRG